uniref:DUF295 domain-containing protein n=1 Tax=Leersia perrieri TaxID=77586 RepID=A0A0D9V2B7_9ORYZ
MRCYYTRRRRGWRRFPTVTRSGDWGDLPDNVLLNITVHLPCHADRVRMACVNKQWRAAVRLEPRPPPPAPQLPPLPPQMPWLIFRNTTAPSFYSWIGCKSHALPLPSDIIVARFCGSADGGWFVPFGQAHYDAAFWCRGSECWFPPRGPRTRKPQDVVFYNGGFRFVTATEGVVVYWPSYGRATNNNNNQMLMRRVEYDMLARADYRRDVAVMEVQGSTTRYLVESRGELLMVARYVYVDDVETQSFRVFRSFDADRCGGVFYFLDEGFVPDTTVVDERPRYSFINMGMYNMEIMDSVDWPPVDRLPTTSDNAPPTWWLP